jgi:arginase
MNRSIAIVGAPTSIGIRTYDSGTPRQLDRAPAVLRELGLVQRLGASDLGDVIPPAYRDYVRPPWYGHAALAASPILDIPGTELSARGAAEVAAAALKRLTSHGSSEEPRGFWIHVDADVMNPTVMAAVDSPELGGPTCKELADLLSPLVSHPRALGLELTIYDPGLDPDRSCATRLVSLMENVLCGTRSLDRRAA